MEAMILAAGEGTRLRPFTDDKPKAMVPVGNNPAIELVLYWLKCHGCSDVAINLYHMGDKITGFLGDGSNHDMRLIYSHEEALLGTAGGVKRVEWFFKDTFVVVYGDVLTDLDLGSMLRFHIEKGSIATMAVSERSNPWELAIVSLDEYGRVLDLVEKPPEYTDIGSLANGGIYILEKEVLNYIPKEASCDFGFDIFPRLVELGLPIYAYTLNHEEHLVDMGTMSGYHQANSYNWPCFS